jgi:tRNA(Ile)-lysidine synthase
MDLAEHLHKSIRQKKLLQTGQPILVAVSGGLDSMVLLHLLHQISQKESWKLAVAHLNHQLRGRSSHADERLVGDTARKLGLPFVLERADVRKLARKHKLSIEMAARKLRHDFLAREAIRLGIQTVALGHHADDQIELFFLRLLRGSGGEGLAGMSSISVSPSNKQVILVRPMLDLSKSDLKEFAIKNDIRFREDASNASLKFQRNRIRHELLPLLRERYQKSLDKIILRVGEIVSAESDFTTQCAMHWLEKLEGLKKPKRRSGRPFEELPVALQRRIVQLQSLKLGFPINFDTVENLRLNPERAVNIPGNDRVACLTRDISGCITLSSQAKAEFQTSSQKVSLSKNPGHLVFDGLRIEWHVASGVSPDVEPGILPGGINLKKHASKPSTPGPGGKVPPSTAGSTPAGTFEYFDAQKIGSSMLLRHWRPGDRFNPIGMQRFVKLQDIFTNEKIPRNKRRSLVVALAENGEVFWVEGLRISENFKVTKTTKKYLHWSWTR